MNDIHDDQRCFLNLRGTKIEIRYAILKQIPFLAEKCSQSAFVPSSKTEIHMPSCCPESFQMIINYLYGYDMSEMDPYRKSMFIQTAESLQMDDILEEFAIPERDKNKTVDDMIKEIHMIEYELLNRNQEKDVALTIPDINQNMHRYHVWKKYDDVIKRYVLARAASDAKEIVENFKIFVTRTLETFVTSGLLHGTVDEMIGNLFDADWEKSRIENLKTKLIEHGGNRTKVATETHDFTIHEILRISPKVFPSLVLGYMDKKMRGIETKFPDTM